MTRAQQEQLRASSESAARALGALIVELRSHGCNTWADDVTAQRDELVRRTRRELDATVTVEIES